MESHGVNVVTNQCQEQELTRLSSILYPVCVEYSLIVGSLFFKLLYRTGLRSSGMNRFRASGKEGDIKIKSAAVAKLSRKFSSRSNMSTETLLRKSSSQNQNDNKSIGNPQNDIIYDCDEHSRYRSILGQNIYVMPGDLQDPDNPMAQPTNYDCHHSHKGLFLGLVQFIAACIGLGLFFMNINEDQRTALLIYQYSKIAIVSTSLTASLCALWRTKTLSFRAINTEDNFEYNLLSIGLMGCLVYHLFVLTPALEATIKRFPVTDNPKDMAELYVVKCTLEFIESIIQFFLLVEVSRRGPHCQQQCLIKPGCSVIMFLLISNLTLWLVNTFEVRRADLHQTLHLNYYGSLGWKVITCSLIPLLIFFRFHSTVCLADIWTSCYRFRKSS